MITCITYVRGNDDGAQKATSSDTLVMPKDCWFAWLVLQDIPRFLKSSFKTTEGPMLRGLIILVQWSEAYLENEVAP